MKRSTQIAIGAIGVVLVAAYFGSESGPDPDENLVFANIGECRAAGQLTASQCEQRFDEASANHVRDAKKFSSSSACEAEYGAGSCQGLSWNNAQVFIPALAGIMLARGLLGGGGSAQALAPPTTQACPPGSQNPECQQARSSSGSGSGGGSRSSSSSSSRAFSTSSGASVIARQSGTGGSVAAPSVSSRGGFGSTSRSFSSSSSS